MTEKRGRGSPAATVRWSSHRRAGARGGQGAGLLLQLGLRREVGLAEGEEGLLA